MSRTVTILNQLPDAPPEDRVSHRLGTNWDFAWPHVEASRPPTDRHVRILGLSTHDEEAIGREDRIGCKRLAQCLVSLVKELGILSYIYRWIPPHFLPQRLRKQRIGMACPPRNTLVMVKLLLPPIGPELPPPEERRAQFF